MNENELLIHVEWKEKKIDVDDQIVNDSDQSHLRRTAFERMRVGKRKDYAKELIESKEEQLEE